MADSKPKNSGKFLWIFIIAAIAAIPVTSYLVSNQTNLSQQASPFTNLNSASEIVSTNNPDGTMGPPTWLNNFAQTLPAAQKGQLAFFVMDPAPQAQNGKPSNAGNGFRPSLPPQANSNNKNASNSANGQANGPQTVTSLILTISKVEVHVAYVGTPPSNSKPSGIPTTPGQNATNKPEQTNNNTDRWETLNITNPTTVDLVQLAVTGDLSAFGVTDLAAGRYTQIRLYVTSASATLENGTSVTLTIPGRNNIVRVVRTFTINPEQTTKLTMDFDAQHSVIRAGNSYILRPVVARLLTQ